MWHRILMNAPSPRGPGRPEGRRSGASRPRLEVLEQRCLLSFSPAASYSVGSNPRAVVTADFDGDGRLDLATANQVSSTVSVRLGNGDGTFKAALTSATGTSAGSLAVGDFNADGKLDLATAGGDLSILLGTGTDSFGSPASLGIGAGLMSVSAGDFNGDGTPDLGVTSSLFVVDGYNGEGEPFGHEEFLATVLLANGDPLGTFALTSVTALISPNPYFATAADVNGDGRQDLVTVNSTHVGTVSVLSGDGGGNLGAPVDFAAGYIPWGVQAGDVNGDGRLDLITAGGPDNSQVGIGVLLADTAGGFLPVAFYSTGTNGRGPRSPALGDFNADGKVDVATANYWNHTVSVLRGVGDGTFSPAVNSAVAYTPLAVVAGDFNGDGWLDAVSSCYNRGVGVVSVLINDRSWLPPGTPSIAVTDAVITEGHSGTRAVTVTVSLSAASGQVVTVAYATADGTTTVAGGDYRAVSGTLTFAAGETSKTITVLVNGDRLGEPDEAFVVNLGSPTNATIADGRGMATIRDDEPRISINDVTRAEGRRGKTTLFTFTVTLSAAYDQPVTTSFRTANGSATTGGGDYLARTGTLTFAPGETTKTITVEVKGDSMREGDETFYLDLFGNSNNSLLSKYRGIGTILNDD